MSSATRPKANPWLIAVVVSLATFMEVLDTTITNVSLSHIAGALAASQEESTWVLTSYLVSNGIVLPLSGWLSQVMGRKRYFVLCIAGFTLTSLLCGLANSLPMLVLFRLLQGLAGGGLQPTQQSIIMDAFPPEKRGAVFGVTGITLILAPALGPTLGGWITDNFSWRWIFFMNIPVGIFAAFMVMRLVEDPPHALRQGLQKLDTIGLGLVVLGIGALQIMLDKGQQEDWFDSSFIISMTVLSLGCLAGAVVWLLRQGEAAMIDLRLLQDRQFAIACILIFLTGFALFSSSALLPLLVHSQLGYNATLAGMVLSPGAICLAFLMPVVGKLVSKVPSPYLIRLGLLLGATGMFVTAQLNPQIDYHTLMLMRVVQVLGLPFLFIPVSTMAFRAIPPARSGKASAFFALARNLGGSIGIAIVTTYLARHMQTRQAVLSTHVVVGDPTYTERLRLLTQNAQDHGLAVSEAAQQAKQMLFQHMQHQAAFLAYHDSFLFLAALMVAAFFATFLLPASSFVVLRKAAPAAAH